MSSSLCGPEVFGADPINIKWSVVRGDTASITVSFLEDDELTPFNISQWDFISTAYDPYSDMVDILTCVKNIQSGTVTITAPAEMTKDWGVGYKKVKINELRFDVQATINGVTNSEDIVWTPIIGSITVLGDLTYN